MPHLFGTEISKEDLLARVGDMAQICGARPVLLQDGPTQNVEAIDFRTGGGLNLTVLPGRGLDVSAAEYYGMSLAWLAPCREVHAAYFEPEGLGWLRGFFGGLIATCGLTYMGAPGEDE